MSFMPFLSDTRTHFQCSPPPTRKALIGEKTAENWPFYKLCAFWVSVAGDADVRNRYHPRVVSIICECLRHVCLRRQFATACRTNIARSSQTPLAPCQPNTSSRSMLGHGRSKHLRCPLSSDSVEETHSKKELLVRKNFWGTHAQASFRTQFPRPAHALAVGGVGASL